MKILSEGAEYEGGSVVEYLFDRDYLCYFQLRKIATEDLKYHAVEGMWFVKPGESIADGVHTIRNDQDVLRMAKYARKGVVVVYMVTTQSNSQCGDNDDEASESDNGSDPEADFSAVPADAGVVHLIDDSDRTSDPEFGEAMANLGLTKYRRKVRTYYQPDGVEVEQMNEVTVNQEQAHEEINVIDDGLEDMGFMMNRSDGSDADDEDSDFDAATQDLNNDSSTLQRSDSGEAIRTEDLEASPLPSFQMDQSVATPIQNPSSIYRASSQSNHDCNDKVDGDEVNSIAAEDYYDPNCDHKILVLKPKLRFTSPQQFKDAVVNHCIALGADINWVRSSNKNKEAVCAAPNCNWRVYASWFGEKEAFVIKAMGQPHTCGRTQYMKGANADWVAKRFLARFRIDPDLNVRHLVREIKEEHGVQVSVRVVANAKCRARRMLEGTLAEQYAKLRKYVLQLTKSDPEGLFVLDVDSVPDQDNVLFKRLFIGFSCLKKGFLKGCRKMFGIDGCFLKGEVKGMLLSAVGKDGNNQMFPICWAVVEGENRSSWGWFIQLLKEQLGLDEGTGWSVISDLQKVGYCVHI
ncbi:hypothetical protein LINPERPRIM_LOCUS9734 [Linum perenne]